jgi:hypothetical protein
VTLEFESRSPAILAGGFFVWNAESQLRNFPANALEQFLRCPVIRSSPDEAWDLRALGHPPDSRLKSHAFPLPPIFLVRQTPGFPQPAASFLKKCHRNAKKWK